MAQARAAYRLFCNRHSERLVGFGMADQFNEAELGNDGAVVGDQFFHNLIVAAFDQSVGNGVADLLTVSYYDEMIWLLYLDDIDESFVGQNGGSCKQRR